MVRRHIICGPAGIVITGRADLPFYGAMVEEFTTVMNITISVVMVIVYTGTKYY